MATSLTSTNHQFPPIDDQEDSSPSHSDEDKGSQEL